MSMKRNKTWKYRAVTANKPRHVSNIRLNRVCVRSRQPKHDSYYFGFVDIFLCWSMKEISSSHTTCASLSHSSTLPWWVCEIVPNKCKRCFDLSCILSIRSLQLYERRAKLSFAAAAFHLFHFLKHIPHLCAIVMAGALRSLYHNN